MNPTEPSASAPRLSSRLGRWLVWLIGGVAGLLAAFFLVSALVHGWEYKKALTGDYALLAVDDREQMNLSRMLPDGNAVGLVRATVFAVGWNDDFILAQQHPPGSDSARVTHFYILRTSNGAVSGPLTAEQFRAERANQGVPDDLDFTLVFDDLK